MRSYIYQLTLTYISAASPLTEPPRTPPADVELTPRVEPETVEAGTKGKRRPREQRLIFDEAVDRPDNQRQADLASILTEHHFLPRSPLVMRLLEIREDPVSHFLPTKTTPQGTFFFAGPPGMVPELAEMFMKPLAPLGGPKRRGGTAASPEREAPPSKRARVEGEGDDEAVEQVRRAASAAPSLVLGSDILGARASVGPGGELEFGDVGISAGLGDDFELDVPMASETGLELGAADERLSRARSGSVLSALSRLSTPMPENAAFDEGAETFADAACPIATFDERAAGASQEQADRAEDGRGYSRNTVKALRLVRQELQPMPAETQEGAVQEQGEKTMRFSTMANKASRRAASAFFFELLVLGTRDCVQLAQSAPYADIEVRAKDRLWERQRHTSVAPSVSSALRQAAAASSSQREPSLVPSAAMSEEL
jgi:cohesin complex subunit SCC1